MWFISQISSSISECFALHGNLFSTFHVYSDKLHINLGQCFALCMQEQNHSLHLYILVEHCTITSSIIMLMLARVHLWHALLALPGAFPPLSIFLHKFIFLDYMWDVTKIRYKCVHVTGMRSNITAPEHLSSITVKRKYLCIIIVSNCPSSLYDIAQQTEASLLNASTVC